MLCDNRNNGEDSRNANVGNIVKDNIVGKAWIRMNTIELISHIDGYKKAEEKKQDTSSAQ